MLVPVLGHSHSEKKLFPHVQEQLPMFQFVPLPLALSLGTTKKSVLLFFAQSLSAFIHIGMVLTSLLFSFFFEEFQISMHLHHWRDAQIP